MKKRFFILISVMLVLLTGCMKELIEEEDRNNIIDALSDEEIIDDSWEFVDWETEYDSLLPTFDAIGYNYIYKDEEERYYTVNMDTLSYPSDNYYGDNQVFMEGGETYFFIEISECDLTIMNETYSNGNAYTWYEINTAGYDCEKYLLHYDKFINIFRTDDLVIEPVVFYDDEETQIEE